MLLAPVMFVLLASASSALALPAYGPWQVTGSLQSQALVPVFVSLAAGIFQQGAQLGVVRRSGSIPCHRCIAFRLGGHSFLRTCLNYVFLFRHILTPYTSSYIYK